ncbi:MAG: arginine--tRNA ligase [Patescibacteria group bacterium]
MTRKIIAILEKVAGRAAEFEVLPSAKPEFGHYSTNLPLRLGKKRGENPLALARELAYKIRQQAPPDLFAKVDVAEPGFINFWLSEKATQEEFAEIAADADYGRLDLLKGKRVMVEYTDPNPFKQFHIGHLMTNVIGESIARLYEANGAEVLRANYQGDVGTHVAKSIWGMMRLESELPNESAPLDKKVELLGRAYAAGAKAYKENEAAKAGIDGLNKKIYERSDPAVNKLYDQGRKWSLDHFETLYARLGTKFVHYFFESEVGSVGLEIVRAHPDVFVESQGAVIFQGENYGLHNRVFINSLGLPTYEAKELGLNKLKFDLYHPDASLVITANEINEYFRVLMKAMELVMPEVAKKTTHIGHGMLRLPSGKMSSRTGEVIAAETLIEQIKEAVAKKVAGRKELTKKEQEEIKEKVALSAIRYSVLKQGIGRDIVFDINKSISFQGDSGPYLQYTYARLRSILRKAKSEKVKMKNWDSRKLATEEESVLIRKMAEFPDIVERGVKTHAPNILATYLYELANTANVLYEAEPILKDEDKSRRAARLVLVETAANVLKNGLGFLGIETPEKI